MRTSIILTVVIALNSFLIGRSPAQEKPTDMPDMATMMKKWMATVSPGPEHKELEKFVGTWDVTAKMYAGGPNTPPMSTKGKSECRMILDGRYLQEELTGEWFRPDETGQMKTVPWKALGLTGYDRYRHMYTAVWADNQSTMLLTMTGMKDPTGKVFTFYGQMDEPMLDVVGRTVKYVLKVEGEKKRTFEIYDLHAGEGYKVVEVTYEKK